MITNSIVVLIVSIFAFIPLILGEYARNRSSITCNDFMIQRRQMSIGPMYATVFATWMSAFAFMGGIAYFFEEGPIYMTTVGWDMLFALLFVVIGKRIWFYGKHHGYMTSVDFFADIYESHALNVIVTVINILSTIIYMLAQVVAAILVFEILTGNLFSVYMSGFIVFFIICIYLWAGGLRAVAYTDLFYMILIIGAMLASGIFLINKAGGTEFVFTKLAEVQPEKISMTYDRVSLWFSLFVIVPIGAFMGPQLWLRNYAAKKEANFNLLPFILGLTSVISIGTLLAGSACIILAGDTSNPDSVLLELMSSLASPYFAIFIAIGIFAAIFSTANSQVHALSATITLDIYRRYINKTASDVLLVSVAKWAVIAICFVTYIFMIIISSSLFDLAVIALAGTAQLMVPVIGALFWPKSSSDAAIGGILCGEVTFVLLLVSGSLAASLSGLIAFAVNALLFIIISLAKPNRLTVSMKIIHYRKEFKNRNTEN